MNFRLLICVLFVSITTLYNAQDVPFEKAYFKDNKDGLKEALKQIKEGDMFYELDRSVWKRAIEFYKKAYDFNPNNSMINYKLGTCYLYSIHKSWALDFLKKAYALNPSVAQDIHLFLGKAHHIKYEFDAAIKEFEKHKIVVSNTGNQDQLIGLAKKISDCRFAKKLMANPERVWIDNLGPQVNSKYPEYSPMINADESVIIFTTRRATGIGEDLDVEDMGYMEDIFTSYKDENGNWVPSKGFDENINTKSHDATSGFSNDGLTVFIYYGHKGMGDIYISQKKDGAWSKAKSIGKKINGKNTHETSACLSYDGKKLYFSSNREGGYGEHDLWESKWDSDKMEWGEPLNMGPIINTKYDERGVYKHPDGKTMYFASNGHPGMGGYDIFYSKIQDNGIWEKPTNIGYPISTPDDDVHFVMSASGKKGYYSSFREDGEGEKDIYIITFLGDKKIPLLNGEDNLLASVVAPVQEDLVQPKVEVNMKNLSILKGLVLDADSKLPVASSIELIDNGNQTLVSEFTNDAESGKYILSLPAGKNYGIAVKSPGYLFHSENFDIPESAGFREYEKIIYLKKIKKGESIVLRNIFFDLDKFAIKTESKTELDRLIKLLEDNPDLNIEISGHTDSRGSASYNQTLSENRSKSVVDYLVAIGGFPRERFEFKGYGEQQPLTTDQEIAKMKIKEEREEAHSQNRRTEFKILD
ncbi:MAG: OmpA family protein [Parvicellaceae bacterium]